MSVEMIKKQRNGQVVSKKCAVHGDKGKLSYCKHEGNEAVCVNCAVFTGHGDKQILFSGC